MPLDHIRIPMQKKEEVSKPAISSLQDSRVILPMGSTIISQGKKLQTQEDITIYIADVKVQ